MLCQDSLYFESKFLVAVFENGVVLVGQDASAHSLCQLLAAGGFAELTQLPAVRRQGKSGSLVRTIQSLSETAPVEVDAVRL